jgi:hypothetical protein
MKIAFGLKAHSGWAAIVAVGRSGKEYQVIDRRRIELVNEGEAWAKQPYHAAERLKADQARGKVKQAVEMVHRAAEQQMRLAVARVKESKHDVMACAVLVPAPMPAWTTEEILAVHFRMHKAEGVLFPEALCQAAEQCKLRLLKLPEKELESRAERTLAMPLGDIVKIITSLGKSAGPPWAKDQKTATLAAMMALQS